MALKENTKTKITDIVGNLVKADQTKKRTGISSDDDDVITLNVGGVRHETKIATLLKKPETRLYSVAEAAKASGKREFYFDRNPQIFPCILNYYRIGNDNLFAISQGAFEDFSFILILVVGRTGDRIVYFA